ncbi:hypothetical protein BH10BAC4_BH10BAC4_02990 [soil metagenome]
MEPEKKSNKVRYALVGGIASGFATLGALSVTIFNDTDAAEISAAVAIFCSLIAVFITGDEKAKSCTKAKTLKA